MLNIFPRTKATRRGRPISITDAIKRATRIREEVDEALRQSRERDARLYAIDVECYCPHCGKEI